MIRIEALIDNPEAEGRLFAAVVLAASAGVLGTAFLFQFVGGLQPCVLCIYQRWPYVAAIVLATGALLFAGDRGRPWLLGTAGAVFLVGAGIAFFHVGVEQHWWQGTASCGGGPSADTVEALKARLLAAPVVRCDEVAWSLFGISMAGYNVLLSLALSAFSLFGAWRLGGARGRR